MGAADDCQDFQARIPINNKLPAFHLSTLSRFKP